MTLALLLAATPERSLAYEVAVGVAMLAGLAFLALASLDAREQAENDGPDREASPDVWDGTEGP